MKIYLAIAYSGNEEAAFKEANIRAGELMMAGHQVFSPISHTHPIAKEGDLPTGFNFWGKYDECFIEWCDELWVCDFGDWTKSIGVTAEIALAACHKKPVKFL